MILLAGLDGGGDDATEDESGEPSLKRVGDAQAEQRIQRPDAEERREEDDGADDGEQKGFTHDFLVV
jgi:hypothetical protein